MRRVIGMVREKSKESVSEGLPEERNGGLRGSAAKKRTNVRNC